jgi:hypothetical protein
VPVPVVWQFEHCPLVGEGQDLGASGQRLTVTDFSAPAAMYDEQEPDKQVPCGPAGTV